MRGVILARASMWVAAFVAGGAVTLGGQARPAVTGGVRTHVVGAKESLRAIASRAGIDPVTIRTDNGLDARTSLKPGTSLRLDNRHIVPPQLIGGTIVINVPQRMLFHASNTDIFAAPVAVGSAGWRTPLGEFFVREKELNPTWDVPPSIAAEARAKGIHLPPRVPPGPSNPLGAHYLALSLGSVGIHGTNAPTSVYQTSTHGCIRMHPDDVAALFARVDVGTAGQFVYEPVLLAADGEDVFLEVHADVYRLRPTSVEVVRALAERLGLAGRVDWVRAAAVVRERAGIARPVTATTGAKESPLPRTISPWIRRGP